MFLHEYAERKKSYLELCSLKLINFSDLIGYFKMLLAKSESPDDGIVWVPLANASIHPIQS